MPPRQQLLPTEVTFPDERQFFPPPEKWTENEYAMFEEPLMSYNSKRESATNQMNNPNTRKSYNP